METDSGPDVFSALLWPITVRFSRPIFLAKTRNRSKSRKITGHLVVHHVVYLVVRPNSNNCPVFPSDS